VTANRQEKRKDNMMMGYGGFGWIGMILNLVITLGVIIGLVLLIVWAVRRTSGNNTQAGTQNLTGQSARDIAQSRYAKGEVSREEYQQILSDLGR
jgi:putative membrane protein